MTGTKKGLSKKNYVVCETENKIWFSLLRSIDVLDLNYLVDWLANIHWSKNDFHATRMSKKL